MLIIDDGNSYDVYTPTGHFGHILRVDNFFRVEIYEPSLIAPAIVEGATYENVFEEEDCITLDVFRITDNFDTIITKGIMPIFMHFFNKICEDRTWMLPDDKEYLYTLLCEAKDNPFQDQILFSHQCDLVSYVTGDNINHETVVRQWWVGTELYRHPKFLRGMEKETRLVAESYTKEGLNALAQTAYDRTSFLFRLAALHSYMGVYIETPF